MAEANEVCRAFRNTGKCRYGDDCQYEHSTGDAIEPPPRGQCFNFKETGSCEYGERCRYLHGEDDDGSRFVKKTRKPRASAEKAAPSGEAPEQKDRAPRKKRERKPRPQPKLDEVCNNYLEGRCRNGAECRRQHEPEGIEQHPEKLDEVCKNFTEGRCRFGDLCRRQHE